MKRITFIRQVLTISLHLFEDAPTTELNIQRLMMGIGVKV